MISPPTCVATDNARALLPVAVGPTTASSSGRPSVVCIDLSRLLNKALRSAPAGAVRGVDLAAHKKCELILDRTLDFSGGDEKVDPNVTIWPIGDV